MEPLACPTCSALAASTDAVCTKCGVALPGRGAARAGIPTWVWITGGVVLGCGGIGCIGLLATFIVPQLSRTIASAKRAAAVLTITELRGAVEHYAREHDGRYPGTLDELTRPDEQGQRAVEPGDLLDPWKNAYVYRVPSAGVDSTTVFSAGPDGIADTDDDVHGLDEFATASDPVLDEPGPEDEMQTDIEDLTVAAIEYATRNGGAFPETLEVLWTPDASGARYVERDSPPRDAWGHAYEYRKPGPEDAEPLVFSCGPDGVAGTEDDVHADDGMGDEEDEDAGDDESTEPR